MAKKVKKEWRLERVLGFSRNIYAVMLALAILVMSGMVIYGVVTNPSTFNNIVLKPYDYNQIGLASAVYEKDGTVQEMTVEQVRQQLAPILDKKVKVVRDQVSGETLYKITFTSDFTEDDEKKSAQTLQLTFIDGYCLTTDLHFGGSRTIKFK